MGASLASLDGLTTGSRAYLNNGRTGWSWEKPYLMTSCSVDRRPKERPRNGCEGLHTCLHSEVSASVCAVRVVLLWTRIKAGSVAKTLFFPPPRFWVKKGFSLGRGAHYWVSLEAAASLGDVSLFTLPVAWKGCAQTLEGA